VRRSIISDGAEIASGALGHGSVAVLPDLPYLKWSFRYENSSETIQRNKVMGVRPAFLTLLGDKVLPGRGCVKAPRH